MLILSKILLSYLTDIINTDNVRNSLPEQRKLVSVIAKDENWKNEHFELVFLKIYEIFLHIHLKSYVDKFLSLYIKKAIVLSIY